MTEIVFQVEEDPDGGLTAKAVGASIFTEAETVEELREHPRGRDVPLRPGRGPAQGRAAPLRPR